MTHFQDLHALLTERTDHAQVLVVTGAARHMVPRQLLLEGWPSLVLDPSGDLFRGIDGPARVLDSVLGRHPSDSNQVVLAEGLLEQVLSHLLAQPWPVTVVETTNDPRLPVARALDWYRGHHFDLLVREGEELVRERPHHVRALTRRELACTSGTSGEHFFTGDWEELRRYPFGAQELLGVEVLGKRWTSASDQVLETAGRILADDRARGVTAAMVAAEALEEER